MRGHAVGSALVLVIAASTLAGCTPPTAPEEGAVGDVQGIDISAYANVHATLDADAGTIRFPIDAYFVDPDGLDRINAANNILLDECMKKSGRSYPPASFDFTTDPRPEERLYGVWSAAQASQYGYAGNPNAHATGEKANVELQGAVAADSGWEPAMDDCFLSADILPSPGRGYVADNLLELTALPSSISTDAHLLASQSEVWTTARKRWFDCLTDNGLTLRTDNPEPWGPVVPEDAEAAIRTAIVDVQCKTDTGLVETLSSLEAQYQAAMIDQNLTALDETAKKEQKIVDRADRILASHGG